MFFFFFLNNLHVSKKERKKNEELYGWARDILYGSNKNKKTKPNQTKPRIGVIDISIAKKGNTQFCVLGINLSCTRLRLLTLEAWLTMIQLPV